MKKAILIFSVLFFVNVTTFAQISGNRIYGNTGYEQNQRRPAANTGIRMSNGRFYIEANVLLNLKPDSFVAVFSVAQQAQKADESNAKANQQIDDFLKGLGSLGILKTDTYVDFITQTKIYDFRVESSTATQYLSGFETKKTIAVKYRNQDLFEKIVSTAARVGIFDLIKVDYIVSDFNAAQERLFDEAVKIVRKKEAKYKESFGMMLKSVGLVSEKYDAFYPGERYQRFQAAESSSVENTGYREGKTIIYERKGNTFFYEPLSGNGFDSVLQPIGVEPTVQFTLYVQVEYGVL
jgi:uncharacterized protein YggE